MFNHNDPVPRVPNNSIPLPGFSDFTPVGNNKDILCYNSSVSPVTPYTRYKGNLKCSVGKPPNRYFRPTLNAHLYQYFINFTANMKSVNQERPEKAYIRIIHWDGTKYNSLFIDNWRCNHVISYSSYVNEIEKGLKEKAAKTILFKCKDNSRFTRRRRLKCTPVTAITERGIDDEGNTTLGSVRYRYYKRNCEEREVKGKNTPNITNNARPGVEKLPEEDPAGTVLVGENKDPVRVGGSRRKTRKRRKRKTRGRRNNIKRKTKWAKSKIKRKTKNRRRR